MDEPFITKKEMDKLSKSHVMLIALQEQKKRAEAEKKLWDLGNKVDDLEIDIADVKEEVKIKTEMHEDMIRHAKGLQADLCAERERAWRITSKLIDRLLD